MSQSEELTTLTAQINSIGLPEMVNQIGTLLNGLQAVDQKFKMFDVLPTQLKKAITELATMSQLVQSMGASVRTVENLSKQVSSIQSIKRADPQSRALPYHASFDTTKEVTDYSKESDAALKQLKKTNETLSKGSTGLVLRLKEQVAATEHIYNTKLREITSSYDAELEEAKAVRAKLPKRPRSESSIAKVAAADARFDSLAAKKSAAIESNPELKALGQYKSSQDAEIIAQQEAVRRNNLKAAQIENELQLRLNKAIADKTAKLNRETSERRDLEANTYRQRAEKEDDKYLKIVNREAAAFKRQELKEDINQKLVQIKRDKEVQDLEEKRDMELYRIRQAEQRAAAADEKKMRSEANAYKLQERNREISEQTIQAQRNQKDSDRRNREAERDYQYQQATKKAIQEQDMIAIRRAKDTVANGKTSMIDSTLNNKTSGFKGTESGRELAMMQATTKAAIDRLLIENKISGTHTETIKKLEKELSLMQAQAKAQAGKGESATHRRAQELFKGGGADLFGIQALLQVNYAIQNAITQPFVQSLQYIAQYQVELANFQAISQATVAETEKLSQTVEHLSATYKFGGVEIAQAATMLAQAGFSAKETEQALDGVVKLAVASGSSLKDSVELATSVIGVFNVSADQTGVLANKISVAMNDSKANINQLGLALQYVGNTAAEANVSFEEILASAGGLANAGIKSGSTIGTGLRQLITEFEAPTDKFKDNLALVGLTVDQVNVKTHGFIKVLETLKTAGFDSTMALNSFEIRSAASFTGLMNNLQDVKNLQESVLTKNALDPAIAAQVETLSAAFSRLTNSFFTFIKESLEPLTYTLTAVLSGFADMFRAVNDAMAQWPALGIAVKSVTTAIGVLLTIGLAAHLAAITGGVITFAASILGLTGGFAGLAAAIGATSVAGTTLGTVMATLTAIPVVAALTAIGVAGYFAYQAFKDTSISVEDAKAKYNELNGSLTESKNHSEALEERLTSLNAKQSDLTEGSDALKASILQANSDFGMLGVTVDATSGKFSDLVGAIRAASRELIKHQQLKELDVNKASSELLTAQYAKEKDKTIQFRQTVKGNEILGNNKGLLDTVDSAVKNKSDAKELAEVLKLVLKMGKAGGNISQAEAVRVAGFDTSKINSFTRFDTAAFLQQGQDLIREFKVSQSTAAQHSYNAKKYNTTLALTRNGAGEVADQIRTFEQSQTRTAPTDFKDRNAAKKADAANLEAIKVQISKVTNKESKDALQQMLQEAETRFNNVFTVGETKAVEKNINVGALKRETLKLRQAELIKNKDVKGAGEVSEQLAVIDGNKKLFDTIPESKKFFAAAEDGSVQLSDTLYKEQLGKAKTPEAKAKITQQFEDVKALGLSYQQQARATGEAKAAPSTGGIDRAAKDMGKSYAALAAAYDKQASTIEKQSELEKDDLMAVQIFRAKAEQALDKAQEAKIASIKADTNVKGEAKKIALEAAEIDFRQRRIDMSMKFAKQEEKLSASTIAVADALDASKVAAQKFTNTMEAIEQSIGSADFKAKKTRMGLYGSQYGEADSMLMAAEERKNTFAAAGAKAPVIAGQITDQKAIWEILSAGLNQAKSDSASAIKNRSELTARDTPDISAKERESLQIEIDAATIREELAAKRITDISEKKVDLEKNLLKLQEEQTKVQEIMAANYESRDGLDYLDNIATAWEIAKEAAQEYNKTQSSIADISSGMYNTLKTTSSSFAKSFSDFARGASTANQAVKGFANSIIDSMMQVVEAEIAKQFMKLIMGFILSVGGAAAGEYTAPSVGSQFQPTNAEGLPGLWHGGSVKRMSMGGEVLGALKTRDSVPALLAPDEVVLNQRSVASIGKDTALDINARGAAALKGLGTTNIMSEKKETTMNVWVVSPDNKPSGLSSNDVVTIIEDNIAREGSIKRLIKQVKA